MVIDYLSKSLNKLSILLFVIFLLLSISSLRANAIVIDFDDVSVSERLGDPSNYPISNEYESLGVIFRGGHLIGETRPDGTQDNQLLSPAEIIFVGPLPTFVSMSVSAALMQAIYLDASGPNGYQSHHQTMGWTGGIEDFDYERNQYVSFASPTGISHIDVTPFYRERFGAIIDDLTFDYTAVPEPSSLMLLMLGCFGLIWRQRSTRINRYNLNA